MVASKHTQIAHSYGTDPGIAANLRADASNWQTAGFGFAATGGILVLLPRFLKRSPSHGPEQA